MTDDPIIAPSALNHGLGEDDILHGLPQPRPGLEPGRRVHHDRRPQPAAIFLEVGYVDGDQTQVIIPAMVAREKFLR